ATQGTATTGGTDQTGAAMTPQLPTAMPPQPQQADSQGMNQGMNQGMDRRTAGRVLRYAAMNGGTISPEDKTYVAGLISQETGLSQAEAEKRIDEVMKRAQDEKTALESKAKEAAETARIAAKDTAIWTAVAMLVGAFAATLSAIWGGRARDF